jgi:hypothetical protein
MLAVLQVLFCAGSLFLVVCISNGSHLDRSVSKQQTVPAESYHEKNNLELHMTQGKEIHGENLLKSIQ